MWKDEIVEEVRYFRNEYASQFNYDLDLIFQDLQAKEKLHPERLVTFLPQQDSILKINQ